MHKTVARLQISLSYWLFPNKRMDSPIKNKAVSAEAAKTAIRRLLTCAGI